MINTQEQKKIDKDLSLLAKSSIIVLIGLLLSKIFTYLYRIIIARYYGPETYGLFSLALMVSGFFIAFASLGLSEGLSRFIPIFRAKKENKKISVLLKFSRNFALISGILSSVLLYIMSDLISINIFHNMELGLFLRIFAILMPFYILIYIYLPVIRSFEKIGAYSFALNILPNFMKVLFLIIFIALGISRTNSVSFSYFSGVLAMLIFVYLYCKIKIPSVFEKHILHKKDTKKIKKELIKFSWPILLVSTLGSLFYWVDSFFIGYYLDASWVGIYNAAVPVAALLLIIPELFMNLFFPMITREKTANNIDVVKEITKQIGKWIFILILPISILIFLFPGAFINILFGSKYLLAETPLRILILAQFIFSLAIVSNNLLLSEGKSKHLFFNMIISVILNAILNIILVPLFGINGAAFATSISIIVWSILIFAESHYYLSILPFRRKMLGIFIISIIPTITLLFLRSKITTTIWMLLILLFIFLLIYLVLILASKSFDSNDLMIIKKVINKIKSHKK